MIALAASVLAASLLGSAHCAGMCGGFVCFYAGQGGRRELWTHAAYNAGRLLAYLALGVLAGLAGHALDRAGQAAGLARIAALVAGTLMLAWGGAALWHAAGGARVRPPQAPEFLRTRFASAVRGVHAQPPAVRALTVGLVTALLPCGWLWTFVATAAGTGSARMGAVVLAAFWLGTVPVMAGLGVLAQRLAEPLRRRLPVLTALLLLVLGFCTLAGKFRVPLAHEDCAPAAMSEVAHVGR